MIGALVVLLVVLRQTLGPPPSAALAEGTVETVEVVAPELPDVDPAARAACEETLREIIAGWIEEARRRSKGKVGPANVSVAVHAVELAPDRAGVLAGLGSDRAMAPASNMKLVTTAAALCLLGPGWEFETVFEAGGGRADGVLQGDLVVRAGGDPLCDPEGVLAAKRLGEAARALVAAGVRRVTGDVVLDEGTFAVPAPPPGWPDKSQHWDDYCALAGGFTANGGVLLATVAPRDDGSARVFVHPSPHGLKENYALKFGKRNDVRVGATVTACTVKGELPRGLDGWSADFAHPDPVELFGSVLLDRLRANGVRVDGDVVRRRSPPGGDLLAVLRSPLEDTLVPINTHSINGVADQVFLTLGDAVAGEGTRAGGMRAAQHALERLGVPTDGFAQVDGSGLSRNNRVSAEQVVALLAAVLAMDDATSDAFFASLAVAGRTGTLEKRMKGTPAEGAVFAKTGWILGTSALSGLIRAPGGRRVLFSILVEYPRVGGMNTNVFKPMQDELVLALLESGA